MNTEEMTWLRQEDGDLFGRRVQAWLAMHHVRHGELARFVGTTASGLSRVLNGRRAFPAWMAVVISQFTGLPIHGDSVKFTPGRAGDYPPSPRRERHMTTTVASCICGFTELDDELMLDHLIDMFEPDDRTGTDGQLHEEHAPLACECGFTAITPDDLDAHLLKAFTPAGAIGADGKKHEPVIAGDRA